MDSDKLTEKVKKTLFGEYTPSSHARVNESSRLDEKKKKDAEEEEEKPKSKKNESRRNLDSFDAEILAIMEGDVDPASDPLQLDPNAGLDGAGEEGEEGEEEGATADEVLQDIFQQLKDFFEPAEEEGAVDPNAAPVAGPTQVGESQEREFKKAGIDLESLASSKTTYVVLVNRKTGKAKVVGCDGTPRELKVTGDLLKDLDNAVVDGNEKPKLF